jgi:SAM-dependent methyltransferase
MNQKIACMDEEILNKQQCHWENVFLKNNSMFGERCSGPAMEAAELFKEEGRTKILELGAGQGRDTLFFANNGFEVYSLDYSRQGIECIDQRSRDMGLSGSITALQHDVRESLPFDDGSFDACFSHMLYCMPLKTSELVFISKEIMRVLKPGGLNIFTTRHTGDPQYRTGVHRGEDMWQIKGGFIVHFLSREKVERISQGYDIVDVEEFEEGQLPKKLFKIALRKKAIKKLI